MSLDQISDETVALLRKAQTNGVTSATGVYGYDLSGVVSLVPVNTPTFDRTPRTSGEGSQAAHWRALLNVNNQQPNPFVGMDGGGSFIQVAEQDVLATYQPVRVSGQVTRDSIDLAKGYEDAKALASISTLMGWRILENKALIGGQAFALPAIGTVTLAAQATGGAIAASTAVAVRIAARSPYNYYWGGSSIASTNVSVTTGTTVGTNSVLATWPAVKGAAAYDVFVAGFYVTTVTSNTYTVTAVPAANATSVPSLPALSTTVPTAVPTVDASFSTNSYNGQVATILGDYGTNGVVTPGTGTSSGATWITNNGAALTGSAQGISQIDEVNQAIYQAAQLSPSRMVMNSALAQEIALNALGTNSAVTYLTSDDTGRSGATVGVSAARYINRASGGDSVAIEVDPHMPAGMILFLTDRIPYPNAGIANVFEARCLRDVTQFEYGVQLVSGAGGGPRDVWDQSSLETLVNRAPVACGVLSEVG
ncbi:MAG: hypothetical protein ACYCV4_02050 [Dermatophilaceae bacterium]